MCKYPGLWSAEKKDRKEGETLFVDMGSNKIKVFPDLNYLELVALSTDAAGQARLLNQLLHLLQQGGLRHHLTLLIRLKYQTQNTILKKTGTKLQTNP